MNDHLTEEDRELLDMLYEVVAESRQEAVGIDPVRPWMADFYARDALRRVLTELTINELRRGR